MTKKISYDDFKTCSIKIDSGHTNDQILNRLIELTMTDPTDYNVNGNRSRLMLIRGFVKVLQGRGKK